MTGTNIDLYLILLILFNTFNLRINKSGGNNGLIYFKYLGLWYLPHICGCRVPFHPKHSTSFIQIRKNRGTLDKSRGDSCPDYCTILSGSCLLQPYCDILDNSIRQVFRFAKFCWTCPCKKVTSNASLVWCN